MRADKLGSAARRALSEVGEAVGPTPFQVLIRVTGEPGEEQRRQIADAARVGFAAGDVLTAAIAPGDLGRLTEVDCVAYVELSEPLRPEAGTWPQQQ